MTTPTIVVGSIKYISHYIQIKYKGNIMLEIGIAIAAGIYIWMNRERVKTYSSTQEEASKVAAKKAEVDMQEDLAELEEEVLETIQNNNGKWHSVKSIDKLIREAKKKTLADLQQVPTNTPPV
jgi:predicted Holliday junction resolvase-like endonuclease